ncbi:MAG: Pyrrolo-quinoline quinone [Pedosphaera sp.]|nr:Pyrrolo-quinoline quinone [Pedosphaera sp.]
MCRPRSSQTPSANPNHPVEEHGLVNAGILTQAQRFAAGKFTALACLTTILSIGIAGHAADLADWPRWRGPNDNGSTPSGSYPVRFDADTGLAWKVALPGKGCSTPIVWNQRIYLTAPIDGQDGLVALDWGGKALWETSFGAEVAGKHRNGSGSNPSPVTDGEALFVQFKSGNLAAVDLGGRIRWKVNLIERYGKRTLYWDYGTSPVLASDVVVVSIMHKGDSYLAGFDKRTGDVTWKVPRNYTTPEENDNSYATPLLIRHAGQEALLVWGAEHLTAHAAKDGRLLWSCGDFNPEGKANWVAVSSPVLAGTMAVVPYGRGSRLHGIRLGGSGDVTRTHRAWVRDGTGTFVPSPVEYAGRVYLVRDRGEVECLDPATGKSVWVDALPKHSSSYYSSPAIAGGKLYAAREDGVVFIAQVDGKFEVLAENPLGERIIASPVPVAGRVLLRGEKTLFCAGEK